MDTQLQDWIEKAKKFGLNDSQIEKQLRAQGWTDTYLSSLGTEQKQEKPRSRSGLLLVLAIAGVAMILISATVYYVLVITLNIETGGEAAFAQVLLIGAMPIIAIVGLIVSIISAIGFIAKKEIIIGVSLLVSSVALALLFRYVIIATSRLL